MLFLPPLGDPRGRLISYPAALGWWWVDPTAEYVLVFYAGWGVREIFAGHH